MAKDREKYNNQFDISDEELLQFLGGQASEEAQERIADQSRRSEFLSDGIQGLQQFTSAADAQKLTTQLNLHLQAQLKNKNAARKSAPIQLSGTLVTAIAIIVLLALIAFGIIYFYNR